MGMPEGKDGKDCTSRRYWGADIDTATGTTNDLLSQGTKRKSDNQTSLILKNAEAMAIWPVEEIGRNSVTPSIMANTMAWNVFMY